MRSAASKSNIVELPVDEVSLTLYHEFVLEFSVACQHLLFDMRTVIESIEFGRNHKSRIIAHKD